MKRLTALMLCLTLALCILSAQALTLSAPFTFDLDTFQAYYPQLIQTDVAWLQEDGWVVGRAQDMPDLQLYLSEAGDVEYMLVELSCPISEADKAAGQALGTVISGAALGVLLCEVTDAEAVNAGVEQFKVELVDVISAITNYDKAKDEEKLAGLTSYGPLANHVGCVGVKANEDRTITFMFVFAPNGTQF